MEELPGLIGDVRGDIVIDSTVDLNLQKLAEQSIRRLIDESGKKLNVSQGALVSIDDSGAAAAVVNIVAGHDEEEALAVGVGTAERIDAADHVADLPLDRGERHRRIVVIRVQFLQHPTADVDDGSAELRRGRIPSMADDGVETVEIRSRCGQRRFVHDAHTDDERFRRDADVLAGHERGHTRSVRRADQLSRRRETRHQRFVRAVARRRADGDRLRGVESGDDAAAGWRGELGVRGHHSRVHDVDDRAAAGIVAAVLAVENAVALIDPVEVPEEIRGGGIAASIEFRGVMRGVEDDLGLAAARGSELLRGGRIDGQRKQ